MIGIKVIDATSEFKTRLFSFEDALSLEHLIAEVTDFLISCFEQNLIAVVELDEPSWNTSEVERHAAEQADIKARLLAMDEMLTPEELADEFIADLDEAGYIEDEEDRRERIAA